ncbi:TPA: hypothetical protein QCQ71_005388 [Bacillus cereus]|uniref:hypothetical protein n=1 Tax=Bacillus TaxID=1386 RepID=UPI000A302B82|nr:hypothetical protein [Bacillus cereus]SMD74011.1 hypothetical protein BACERE00188_00362 [Bacillus cereus]HDR4584723.1 hypothetical protein [Bacillus cereus]
MKKYVQLVQIEIDGILVDAKECTNCGVVKSLDRYNAKKNGLGKKASKCKECNLEYRKQRAHIKAEYDKRYREENSEKIKQYRKEWYEENREADIDRRKRQYYDNHERELAARKKYREENIETLKEYMRKHYHENKEKYIEYRERNKEQIIAYRKRKYQENKEEYSARYKVYYKENQEYHRERRRKHYFENWDKSRARNKKWFKDNPDQAQVIRMRRRTREYLLPDDITYDEVEEIKMFFGGCALTGETDDIHLDHVIPLATGRIGAVCGNIIPLKGSLNESKRDKNIFEWFKHNKEYWNLSQEKFDILIDYLAEQNDMSVEEYKDYVYWCHENPVQMDIDVENGIVQLSLL